MLKENEAHWKPFKDWFQRHRLLNYARRWLVTNPKPYNFVGSKWRWAYLEMPMRAMEISVEDARRIFSDQPIKPGDPVHVNA
jgi:hypothetical protein